MIPASLARIAVLVCRIDDWEGMDDAVGQLERSDELILDIKQCLESILLEESDADGR